MSPDYFRSELCEAFDVSRSGYHAWVGRQPSARDQAAAQLQPLILTAHREGRKEYGRPRVVRWLRQHGHPCSRRRIGRLMRRMGLAHRPGRRFKPMSLTDSNHDLPRAAIFEWIEVFYNRVRFHSALGYQSPVDFETHLN